MHCSDMDHVGGRARADEITIGYCENCCGCLCLRGRAAVAVAYTTIDANSYKVSNGSCRQGF